MRRLQLWFLGICVWFFLLYNVERLGGVVNIASFVYVYVLLCTVLIVLIPRLQDFPVVGLFLAALIPYFLLKVQLGYEIGGANVAITVTEISAIWLTILLAEQMAAGLREVRQAVRNLTLEPLLRDTFRFDTTGQGQIYREIRRARRYKRPAALLAVKPAAGSVEVSLERLVLEAQRQLMDEYVAARVAKLLIEELKDTDIVAKRNGHFIVLLPETSKDALPTIMGRLAAAGDRKLGLELDFGYSAFPDEAVTLERLVALAEEMMQGTDDQPTVDEAAAADDAPPASNPDEAQHILQQ